MVESPHLFQCHKELMGVGKGTCMLKEAECFRHRDRGAQRNEEGNLR